MLVYILFPLGRILQELVSAGLRLGLETEMSAVGMLAKGDFVVVWGLCEREGILLSVGLIFLDVELLSIVIFSLFRQPFPGNFPDSVDAVCFRICQIKLEVLHTYVGLFNYLGLPTCV